MFLSLAESDRARGVFAVVASLLVHALLGVTMTIWLSGHRLHAELSRSRHGGGAVFATFRQVSPATTNVALTEGGSVASHGLMQKPQAEPRHAPLSPDRPGTSESLSGTPRQDDAGESADEITLFLEYASAKELSKQPSLVGALPDISISWVRSAPGIMFVDVFIDEFGVVREARVVDHTNMPRPFLVRIPALLKKMRFVPGEIESKPVASRIRIEITVGDGSAPEIK